MASTTTERPPPPPPPRKRAPSEEQPAVEPWRVAHRLTWRVGALGVVVLVVFAALFLRLWALQVLAGTKYVDQAGANSYRTVRVQAPRGSIVDRDGKPLVMNAPTTAVQLWPADLPKVYVERYRELQRVSRLTQVPLYEIAAGIKARRGDPLTPVTVRDGASKALSNYLAEHANEFPGVTLGTAYIRHYPYHSLAAQLLGYVGEISSNQLDTLASSGYQAGDEIGQSGVESTYDRYLRGVAGAKRLHVDSLNHPHGSVVTTLLPKPGHTLRLTLDLGLQQAAEKALQYGIRLAQNNGQWARTWRSDRRARPEGRLDPCECVVPGLRAVRLRGPRLGEGAREPGAHDEDRRVEEHAVVEPRDDGPVSARLRLQAGDGARGDAGASRQPVLVPPLHRAIRLEVRQGRQSARVPQLGSDS